MKVETRVQHHPDRARLIRPLLARLPARTVVVLDPDPTSAHRSPLRTYVEALSLPVEDYTTHLLVIQDDAWPVDGFEEKLTAALLERPDALVALFAPGSGAHRRSMVLAHRHGERWARLNTGWIPTVALVWPVYRAREFVAFVNAKYDPWTKHRGDDAVVGSYATKQKVEAYAPVPSLVEHPDIEPSLIGRKHYGGRNRARVAATGT